MPSPTVVIDVAGLSKSLIGDAMPHLRSFSRGGCLCRLEPVLPAVTCPVQATMLTGTMPCDHGIVGNGWYDRELAEIHFWKQSSHLVAGEKVWESARRRDPAITCATLFWWYNMYSTADYSVTPRPIYKADGRKLPDCYSRPPELRTLLTERLGVFPLYSFWGPGSSIVSSRWIADAAKIVYDRFRPTLTLVYLPHLDYALQMLGPDHPDIGRWLGEIDEVVGDLLGFFEDRGVGAMVLSEYGIEPVDDAAHVNRVLREEGALAVRREQGCEVLDAGASEAFAVADHQIAHVYVRDGSRLAHIAEVCGNIPGVEQVLDRPQQRALGLDHPRAGDLVLVARPRRWFSYYYWLDETRAPDFARTVDIHRKPGYDPLELFVDPGISLPRLRIAWKLFKARLGFRTLMDVIGFDTTLLRGSHGRIEQSPDLQPVLITTGRDRPQHEQLACRAVRDVILEHLFSDERS